MSTATDIHPLAEEYLKRLGQEAHSLPRATRAELEADIESHLAEATSPDMSAAEVLTVLDRLGDPAEIVGAHQPTPPGAPPARRGTHEWGAIFLLLFGGFIFGIGWIFGLVLLWSSNAWRTRDKWIGTLIVPGGFASLVLLGTLFIGSSSGGACSVSPAPLNGPRHAPQHLICTASSGPDILGILLLIVLVAAPILTAIYLARKAGDTLPAAS